MLARALFCLGGLAVGVILALVVEGLTSHPAALRRDVAATQAENRRLTENFQAAEATAREAQRLALESAEKAASSAAEVNRLLDEKADLEAELQQAEDAREAEKTAKDLEKAAKEVAIAAAQRAAHPPSLGRCSGFKIAVLFEGTVSDELAEKANIKPLIIDRLEALTIPTVDKVTERDHAALLVTVSTAGASAPFGGSVSIHVGQELANKQIVALAWDSLPFASDDVDDLVRDVLLAVDSLGIRFQKRYFEEAIEAAEKAK